MNRRRIFAAGILAGAAFIGLGWWRTHTRASADFAGASSCQGCHPRFYQLWSTSHHGLAMQAFTPQFARRELTPVSGPIRSGDSVYLAGLEEKGGWVEERSPGGTHRYPIDHAMGGKNIYYFLTTLNRGRLQVLPLAYDVRKKSWIDATASMTVHELGPSAEPLHWRDRMLTFNTSCYGCHVSQLATNYDSKTDSYHTTWLEPGINCEACHGASAGHVRSMKARQKEKRGGPPQDLKLTSVKKLSTAQRNDLCATCHAKLLAITSDFKPGDRFFDHYSVVALESDDFFPDGRDYRENYTLTSWMMSPCAKAGKLDCIRCHTSSGRFRFQNNNNDACLPCHEERVRNAAAHTHHNPDSVGSQCISCHMPTTEYALMRRTDHSMRPPTPAATIAYKSPNACNLCHSDKDAAWADKQVRRWHKRDYQAQVLSVAGLVDAARKRNWSRLPGILAYIGGPDRDEIFAASLIRLLWNCRDARKIPVLLQSLKDSSPLIRATAVDALSQDLSPQTVPALAAAASDEYRVVRIRTGAALASVPSGNIGATEHTAVERAVSEYLASLKTRPDDYSQHLNLGIFYAGRGRLQESVAEYERATLLRPDFIPALVNASVLYSQMGQNAKAEDALRRAVQIDPRNSAAQLNLGLLLAETNRLSEAETALRKSLEGDPTNAAAAYNLSVLLGQEHPEEAIGFARQAVRLRPDVSKYADTLAFLRRHATAARPHLSK